MSKPELASILHITSARAAHFLYEFTDHIHVTSGKLSMKACKCVEYIRFENIGTGQFIHGFKDVTYTLIFGCYRLHRLFFVNIPSAVILFPIDRKESRLCGELIDFSDKPCFKHKNTLARITALRLVANGTFQLDGNKYQSRRDSFLNNEINIILFHKILDDCFSASPQAVDHHNLLNHL